MLESAVFHGRVGHRRFAPKQHSFEYSVFMMYLDLDELDSVLSLSQFWGRSVFCFARFKRQDFFGDPNLPLKQAVLDKVESELEFRPSGAVRMLTNLRYFSYIINPLTVYHCFDKDNQLRAVLLEVTNTPWGERCQYVIPCNEDGSCHLTFDKKMHVSPFHPMDLQYEWHSKLPESEIGIYMKNMRSGKCVFDASLNLERKELSSKQLNNLIFCYPLMTAKVALSIYWQALRLWFKGVPFFSNPQKMNNKVLGDLKE